MAMNIDVEMLQSVYNEIVALDTLIDSASGSAGAGRRAISNRLVAEQEDAWSPAVENMVTQITSQGLDIAALVGLVEGMTRGLNSAFATDIDAYLDAEVEAAKADNVDVSDTELDAYLADGREKRKVYEAMRNMLELLGEDVSGVEKPKRLVGSRGSRGPRLSKKYNYVVDGKPRSDSSNNLSSVFQTDVKGTEGCEAITSTKDLKAFLDDNGFDFNEPQDEYSVTLPNGKVLQMTVASTTESYDAGGEEDEED